MQDHLTDEGHLSTAHASRYLQQLCKHFGHKVEVRFDETNGEASLPSGPATLRATPTELLVTVSAGDDEGLERSRTVIDSHLERFAFREEFKGMNWSKNNE